MPKYIITTRATVTRTYTVTADSEDAAKLNYIAESGACELVGDEDDNEVIVGVAEDFKGAGQ
jgi:hypothetical protein